MLTSILESSAIFAGSSFGGTIAEPPPVVEDNTNYEEFGGLVTVSQGDRYYTDTITCAFCLFFLVYQLHLLSPYLPL